MPSLAINISRIRDSFFSGDPRHLLPDFIGPLIEVARGISGTCERRRAAQSFVRSVRDLFPISRSTWPISRAILSRDRGLYMSSQNPAAALCCLGTKADAPPVGRVSHRMRRHFAGSHAANPQ